jgi:hypothetical protein
VIGPSISMEGMIVDEVLMSSSVWLQGSDLGALVGSGYRGDTCELVALGYS